jgi:glycosyltransferase involved in cell wall biosynthesis
MSEPISAVLIVLDGERHLERVLAALRSCDEILILDSGSTDRTHEIAKAAGARVEHQAFLGYGKQKQRAVELAKHDWVLVVDDDEVLDEEAAAAIARLDLADPARCWRLRRRTYIGTQEVRHGIWSPDYSLRLFNRAKARFNDATVHESVQPGGPVLTLPGALHHYSYSDYADVFSRMGGYARTKAAGYRARGRRCGALKLAARAMWSFWRSYLFKLGFLDGRAGVIVALSLAIDATCSLAMASEPEESRS